MSAMPFQEDVYFANDTSVLGDGSLANPHRGPASDPDWFDAKIASVGRNQTVRLGPGTFLTRGVDVNGAGWGVRNGMRLLGSGISATVLKLHNAPAANRCALGVSPLAPLEGFEASDFTIDLNFSGPGATPGPANRAVFVYGSHIYLRRLRVVNYGGTSAAQMVVLQAGAVQTENSVIEECSIEPGASTGAAACVLAGFGGNSGSPHRYCVVRNCFLRGTGGDEATHGIMPGCGLGFVAEGNELVDLTSGIYDPPYPPGMEVARDLILRHNYFRNVLKGIDYSGRASRLQRMIVHDNVMDVRTGGTGIALLGNTNPVVYQTLIIRKNIIRNVAWDGSPGTITGIDVSRAQDLTVQFNTLNNTTSGNGVRTANVTNSTVNNNINTQGAAV